MPERAPIVVFATLKGGSGKTTAAATLAIHSRLANQRVTVFDADPQASLLHWKSLGRPPLDLEVIPEISEEIGRRAWEAALQTDLVVVDTAGFRNRTMIEALSVADLAVIPIRASPLDIAAALQTVRLIKEINETQERADQPILFRLFLNQITQGSIVARHVRSELESAGHQLLTAELVNRVIYAEAMIIGRVPVNLDPQCAAARDGEAFAVEIFRLLGNSAQR